MKKRWAVAVVAAVVVAAAGVALAEVQLVTEPRPGEEYVSIHADRQTAQPDEFSTAHQIPARLRPRELPDDEFSTAHHVTRPQAPLAPRIRDVRQVSQHEIEDAVGPVEVTDEGTQGVLRETRAEPDEKAILEKKLDVSSKKIEKEKKEDEPLKGKDYKTKEGLKKVHVELEGNSGVRVAPVHEDVDDIAVPPQKFISAPKQVPPTTILPKSHYDVIPVNKVGDRRALKDHDEGTFDFVDSPLGDKQLASAGTSQSQASRVNVKKGPNGQDYEYEYVYYYYDEDDELVGPAKPGPATARAPAAPVTDAPRRRPSPTPSPAELSEEPEPSRPASRNRYTTIERNRVTGTEVSEPTTPEPGSNEVLPQTTRGGNSRFRGRTVQATPEPVEQDLSEERLPANTRFPPRSRSNHNSSPVTTPPPATDTPITRIRGSVRRPSLELVDSSSFRTHSSDVSPDQDHSQVLSNDPEPPSRAQTRQRVRPASHSTEDSLSIAVVPPVFNETPRFAGTTRESDINEYIEPSEEERLLTPQRTQPQTLNPTTEQTSSTPFISAMTDKAAFDLYALLRETENEQSNLLINEPTSEEIETTEVEYETTQPPTTVVITTVPSTTTTTTTPTTTTTTTTPEPSPAPPAPGRGRYRGGVGGRNKFKASSGSTTTTTEATEEQPKRAKFSPNRNREPSQGSSFGRRGLKTTPSPDQSSGSSSASESTTRSSGRSRYRGNVRTSSSTEAPASSSVATTSGFTRPSFGSDRFNARRRGGAKVTTSTAVPVEEDKAEVGADSEAGADDSASASSTARPTRPRLSIGTGVRPLRPGPRINIGGRGRLGGQSSTVAPAPASEEPPAPQPNPEQLAEQPDNPEQIPETTPTPQPADTLTRLRNRPRLHVGAKAKPVATQPPANSRRALVSGLLPRRRPGATEAPTEATATEESKAEEEPVETSEATSTTASTTEGAPQESGSRLSTLIGGRRRLPGRRPGLLPRPVSSAPADE